MKNRPESCKVLQKAKRSSLKPTMYFFKKSKFWPFIWAKIRDKNNEAGPPLIK